MGSLEGEIEEKAPKERRQNKRIEEKKKKGMNISMKKKGTREIKFMTYK